MDYTHKEPESPQAEGYGARTPTSGRADLTATNGHDLSPRALERVHRNARGLGWFSLGLGMAEVLAPRGLSRMIGVGDDRGNRRAMRAIGLREIASGIGILSRSRPTGWLWSRVVGDVMDIALLGWALGARKNRNVRVPLALASVAGVTALDLFTSRALSRADRQGVPVAHEREVTIRKAVTVARPAEELYRFWRNFQNLPTFMNLLDSVEVIDDRRSRWRMRTPRGKLVEWESEIIEDRPHDRISWRASAGSPLQSSGEVRFVRAPGGRGTEVHLTVKLEPPGGPLTAAVARTFKQAPEIQVQNDLRRFKQVIEVGEVVCSDASLYLGPHPARPPSDEEIDSPGPLDKPGRRA
jgi:uncharacterized membrane protein